MSRHRLKKKKVAAGKQLRWGLILLEGVERSGRTPVSHHACEGPDCDWQRKKGTVDVQQDDGSVEWWCTSCADAETRRLCG